MRQSLRYEHRNRCCRLRVPVCHRMMSLWDLWDKFRGHSFCHALSHVACDVLPLCSISQAPDPCGKRERENLIKYIHSLILAVLSKNNSLNTNLNLANCCWITSPWFRINFIRRSMLFMLDFGCIVCPWVIHANVERDARCLRRRTIALLMLPVGLPRPLSRSPPKILKAKLWFAADGEWWESERRLRVNLTWKYTLFEKLI